MSNISLGAEDTEVGKTSQDFAGITFQGTYTWWRGGAYKIFLSNNGYSEVCEDSRPFCFPFMFCII